MTKKKIHGSLTTSTMQVTDCGRGYWTYGRNKVEMTDTRYVSRVTLPDGTFFFTTVFGKVTCGNCLKVR